MNPFDPYFRHEVLLQRTRRHFLRDCASGLGALWLASNAGRAWGASGVLPKDSTRPLRPVPPALPARAKRVITWIFGHTRAMPYSFVALLR